MKKLEKAFDVRGGKLCFLETPLNIKAAPDSGGEDEVYAKAAVNAHDNKKLPKGVTAHNLKISIRLALRESGKCPEQYIPNAITLLGIDLLPQGASVDEEQSEPDATPSLGRSFAERAKAEAKLTYEQSNRDVKVGDWELDTNAGLIFFKETPLDAGSSTHIALTELLINFPAPLTFDDFTAKANAAAIMDTGEKHEQNKLIDIVKRAGVSIKRNEVCFTNPFHINPETQSIFLRTDLKGLTPQQKQDLGVAQYQHVAVSAERNTVWNQDELVDITYLGPEQIGLMEAMFRNNGSLISIEDVPQFVSPSQVTSLNKKLDSLNIPSIKAHRGNSDNSQVSAIILCTQEEWVAMLKKLKSTPKSEASTGAALGNPWADDVPHAPQML